MTMSVSKIAFQTGSITSRMVQNREADLSRRVGREDFMTDDTEITCAASQKPGHHSVSVSDPRDREHELEIQALF